MPPKPHAPMTDAEVQLIGRWIEADAPSVGHSERSIIRNEELITRIYHHLEQAIPSDRIYLRYFSLAHLYNNTHAVSDDDLAMFRAAFVKLLNSVSRNPNIYVPETIDPQQTVFCVDIRRLDWDARQWNRIIRNYPYGFSLQQSSDEQLADLDRQIDERTQTSLCWIRADWFVAKASRAPLYNELLDLPSSLSELEATLGVDVVQNFKTGQSQRAGFVNSGVSTGHRMLERHRARDGYYWKSFDFGTAGLSRDVIRTPLGPKGHDKEFDLFAFEHDGGEIIFSLPNGLQGYMLVDGVGKSIDDAPIEIVRDAQETGGTPQVINAVSCIHCHRHGIIPFKDAVREGSGLFGKARVKIRQLFPPQEVMDQQVARDRSIFMSSVALTMEPYVRNEANADKAIEDFQEPVGLLVRHYDQSLSHEAIAGELGLEPSELRIGRDEYRLGLRPLEQGGSIKRQYWESLEMYVSPFQQTIQSLGIATPVR
ncbi:MAG: hypothetical protein R3C05_17425 [Pirellulaceae bacterium]